MGRQAARKYIINMEVFKAFLGVAGVEYTVYQSRILNAQN